MSKKRFELLSDAQWELIAPLLPEPRRRTDKRGRPWASNRAYLGTRLESASPGEVTLAEATLAEVKVPRPKGRPRQKPKRVIVDRAYDSDPLRER